MNMIRDFWKPMRKALVYCLAIMPLIAQVELNLLPSVSKFQVPIAVMLLLLSLVTLRHLTHSLRLFFHSWTDHGKNKAWSATENDLRAAETVFQLLEIVLPLRLCNEDLGDARELIGRLVEGGKSKWMVYAKVVSTLFWASLSALRELASILGRKSPSR